VSAGPDPVRLSDEDLDLLLSRALDEDLSPEEERHLEEVLASDPRAVGRREGLSALVGRLNALPDPAPPLGLTARTNAWTAERSGGIGALWHRLGLFPPPGMVRGIGALFVIVLLGMSVLRSQSVRQKAAESSEARDDGRVAIFFGERGPSTPSAPSTPMPQIVTAAPAANAPFQKSKGIAREPASSSELKAARAPLAWDVTVAEGFARGWALRRVVALPPSGAAPPVSYRVRLDAEGKVVSAWALDATTAERDAAVRSLVFQKLAAEAPAEIEIALAAR
jgi:hypothetical protein